MILNVLGIDGSLQNFGLAAARVELGKKRIITVDCLKLSKTVRSRTAKRGEDDFERFRIHWDAIRLMLHRYQPSTICGELPSGSRDVRAAFAFGGVTAMLAGLGNIYKVKLVTPSQVKEATTGVKHADKEDMIKAVYEMFPNADWIKSKLPNAMNIKTEDGLYLTNANEHLADAVGTILAVLKNLD